MKTDTMQNENNSNKSGQSNGEQDEDRPKWLPRWLFTLIGPLALILIVVGGIAAYYAYYYVTKDSVRVQFWIGFLFSFMALVVVTIQVVIYAQQAEFMKRQWNTMQDAIHRQKADLMQWVEIRPLGIRTEALSAGSEPPSEVEITLRWKVLNQTRLPFTLEEIDMKICREKDWECFEMIETEVVPPMGHDARNFYPFFVQLKLTKDQTKEFLGEGLGLSIAIRVIWTDAIGKPREQRFGDLYECGTDRMEISEPLGRTPTFLGIEEGSEEGDLVYTEANVVAEFTVKDTN